MVRPEKSRPSTQMTDLHQTPQYAKFMSLQDWNVERVNGVNYFIRRFSIFGHLIGSILKIQRPEIVDITSMIRIIEKYKVFQTIVEPDLTSAGTTFSRQDHNLLLHHGFKLSKSPYLPTKTLQIDLTRTINDIYSDLQRNIKTGIKRNSQWGSGLLKEYSTPDKLRIFHDAWKKSVKFSRYVPDLNQLINLRKSFPGNYSLFLASHNIAGRIIGGVIFTRCLHDSVNYMYGFMSREGRTSLTHAGLLYQGILWGKKMGCKVFDFEGIYDERFPNKSWLGFSRFKKSFGGNEVLYPGCYTKLRLLR